MPPFHFSSTSRALYRVFVAPNLSPARLQHAPTFSPSTLVPRTSLRLKSYKKDTRRHAITDHYTLDAAITAPIINLVDPNGTFLNSIPITRAQNLYNKTTHHLMLLNPGRVDEFGVQDPEFLPTCKIIPKIELRAQHEKKLDIERRKAKGGAASGSVGAKSLELNWAIAGGDLKHRLDKLKEFLREGRKVEVVLGPKRRGKKATSEECNAVLRLVRAAVDECKGAGEVKTPEGVVGGVMTLVFEGRRIEGSKKIEVAKQDDVTMQKAIAD